MLETIKYESFDGSHLFHSINSFNYSNEKQYLPMKIMNKEWARILKIDL